MALSAEYAPLPTDEGGVGTAEHPSSRIVALTGSDKWRLVKPIIPKYMLPLCKYPTFCARVGSLILTPPQVCVYLVGRHLGKSPSNLLTNLFSSSSIQSTRFVGYFVSSPNLRLKVGRASLRLYCIRSLPLGSTPSLPC